MATSWTMQSGIPSSPIPSLLDSQMDSPFSTAAASGADQTAQIQREASKLLIILAPIDHEQAEDLIEQVSNEYKTRFEQEAVLKTIRKTCVAFLNA